MEGQIQATHDLYSNILAANKNKHNLGVPSPEKVHPQGPKPWTENRKSQTLNVKP
mgnify:CR=1 FL=1